MVSGSFRRGFHRAHAAVALVQSFEIVRRARARDTSAAAMNVGRQFKMPDTAASVRARAQSCSAVVARSCSRRRAGMRSSARPPASSERIGWLALRELLHLCYELGAAGDADGRQAAVGCVDAGDDDARRDDGADTVGSAAESERHRDGKIWHNGPFADFSATGVLLRLTGLPDIGRTLASMGLGITDAPSTATAELIAWCCIRH